MISDRSSNSSAPVAPDTTTTTFLARVKEKDFVAWKRLCKVYGPLVYRWSRKAGLQDQDAADICQEVFKTVSGRVADFRRDRPEDTFRGWLWMITHNKLGDHFRRREAQPDAAGGTDAYQKLQDLPEAPRAAAGTSDESGVEVGVATRMLEVVRDEFEEGTWQAFWRATIDGDTVANIAADLGISPHAVRQAKYRVLRRLRTELG